MGIRFLTRRDLIGLSGAAAVAALFGGLADPLPARASGNKIITYSDGVGMVDQYGNSLIRAYLNLTTIGLVIPEGSCTLPSFPTVGVTYPTIGGQWIQNNGNGSYNIPNGSVTAGWPSVVTDSPFFNGQQTLVAPLINPHYVDKGEVCHHQPCPQTLLSCAVAFMELALATAAMISSGLALGIPGVDIADAIAFAGACIAYQRSLENYYNQCGLF